MQGDFSLVDGLYQPNYITVYDQNGDHIDIEADKGLINQFEEIVTIGPCRVIFESSDCLCLHRYIRFTEDEPQYNGVITAITY